jgi:hypothetical protein
MKHEISSSRKLARQLSVAALIILLNGCTGWNSAPERLKADYGQSVRNLVNNQIYYPEKSQHPDALAPDVLDGMKADTILKDGYRSVLAKPDEVRKRTSLSVMSSGSGGGGMGGGGMSGGSQ